MACEICDLSVQKLRHQGCGRVWGWLVSCLLIVVGRNWDCSLSDGPEGIVVFASPCRETALSIWPQQGVTLFVYSCLLRREEDRELNGLYDLSWRRKVSWVFAVSENIAGKLYCQLFMSARRGMSCYFFLPGKEHSWMSSSCESRNPHFHFCRLVFWNCYLMDALSQGFRATNEMEPFISEVRSPTYAFSNYVQNSVRWK